MKPHERILHARRRAPSPQEVMAMGNEAAYQAFLVTEGYPETGFTLFCADGSMYGFLYPNMENLRMRNGEHRQHLTFTHRGIAVTLSGHGLYEAFHGIMQQTLVALYEHHDGYEKPEPDAPIIERAVITILPGATGLQ